MQSQMTATVIYLLLAWGQSPRQPESRRDALVRKVVSRLANARSMSGTIEQIDPKNGIHQPSTMRFKLLKPNFESVVSSYKEDSDFISDGKWVYIVLPAMGTCGISDADPHGIGLPPDTLGLSLFFDSNALKTRLWAGAPIKYSGVETFDKRQCQVLTVGPSAARPNLTIALYVDSENRIVRELSTISNADKLVSHLEYRYKYDQPGRPITKRDFKYKPLANLQIIDHRASSRKAPLKEERK